MFGLMFYIKSIFQKTLFEVSNTWSKPEIGTYLKIPFTSAAAR